MDVQNFLKAWKNSPEQRDPYSHYIVKDIFDPQLLKELQDLPFEPQTLDYQLGRREEFNAHRQYLNPEVIEAHDCARRVADIFLDPVIW